MTTTTTGEAPPRLAYAVSSDVTGRLKLRRYATQEEALTAAKRVARRTSDPLSVVWLTSSGSPKVWLAHVKGKRVEKTEFWR
jgi:hypothetical protein